VDVVWIFVFFFVYIWGSFEAWPVVWSNYSGLGYFIFCYWSPKELDKCFME
jgi:hypothetical protein